MESLGVIQFWTFLAGVIVIILMPGPNSLFVLKTSIVQGPKHAWCALCAVLLGDATLILLSYQNATDIPVYNRFVPVDMPDDFKMVDQVVRVEAPEWYYKDAQYKWEGVS